MFFEIPCPVGFGRSIWGSPRLVTASQPPPPAPMKVLSLSTAMALLAASSSYAQSSVTLFSVDWRGPTVGLPDPSGVPITAGDILTPSAGMTMLGPLMTPSIAVPHGPGGLFLAPGCIGVPGGTPCHVEVDAYSRGLDAYFNPSGIRPGQIHFSTDEFAVGAGPVAPNVVSEFPVGDSSSDVMLNTRMMPAAPIPPGPGVGHRGIHDGDGLFSGSGHAYPGLGLIEPALPSSTPARAGDNLDALDNLGPGPTVVGPNYFSLDSGNFDPQSGFPNTASGPFHGFTGAEVLVSGPLMGGPAVYAPAFLLGLNLAGDDDLDALILRENGDGVFQASQAPNDWLTGGTDMLLFSVRRGSAVIGMPDSIFGIPIEEGDILTTPLPATLGGVSPFPGIFVAAENLNLATVRAGFFPFADDLNALDSVDFLIKDCDSDGIEDVVAIANGFVPDTNLNGIPDPCEVIFSCTPLPNSTTMTTLLTGMFTGSPGTGLHLEATQGPPTQFGYFLIGTGLQSPGMLVGSGRLCLATSSPNMIGRYNFGGSTNSIGQFDAAGVLQNLVGTSTVGSGFDVPTAIPFGGTILPGQTWHFQLWHRDIPATSNFSNYLSWTF